MDPTKSHRHRVASTRVKCFSGPVTRRENRAAHGGTCDVDRCTCGATRETNVNGSHHERGPWIERDVWL